MKSAGKARNNGLYRHIRTSKEIIRNLLNDCGKIFKAMYEPFLISKASAKVACEGKLHNHIINSHYGNL